MKVEEIEIKKIVANPNQSRKTFNSETIQELANSIKENGLLQPITVTRYGDRYSLVSGERRLRACGLLRWGKIPAIIKNVDETQLLVENLVENLQREDLSPLERANGIKNLINRIYTKGSPLAILKNMEIKKTHEFSAIELEIKKQLDSLGTSLGKVINYLKVLELPKAIQDDIELRWSQKEDIARLDATEQKRVYKKVKKEKLGVSGTKLIVDKVVVGEVDKKTLKPTETYNKDAVNLVKNGAVILRENVTQFLSEFETFPEIIKKKVLEKISELMIVCEELARKIEGSEAEEFDEVEEERSDDN